MKVVWSPLAEQRALEAVEYIAQDRPRTAAVWLESQTLRISPARMRALSAKSKNPPINCGVFILNLAERVGFEPTVDSRPRLISSQVHSTTLPPLLWNLNI